MTTHYDTLGVSRNATIEEIKHAFRQLSLEHHPDRNSDPKSLQKFQKISHAAGILTNQAQRQAYDYTLPTPYGGSYDNLFDRGHDHGGGGRVTGAAAPPPPPGSRHHQPHQRYRGNGGGGPIPTNGLQQFTETIFRPRNMIIGSLAIYGFVKTVQYYEHLWKDDDDHTSWSSSAWNTRGDKRLVPAWKNPSSGEWEPPAPWDPIFQQLKPRIEVVPREFVKMPQQQQQQRQQQRHRSNNE